MNKKVCGFNLDFQIDWTLPMFSFKFSKFGFEIGWLLVQWCQIYELEEQNGT